MTDAHSMNGSAYSSHDRRERWQQIAHWAKGEAEQAAASDISGMIAATPREEGPGPHVYNLRLGGKLSPGSVLLLCAAVLLLGLAAAQGYVSYRAQFAFINAAKHARTPSMLEAVGLDTGAVIFALLGLAHARMGRPARIERALNLVCAFGSMTMNLLGADLASPRSIAVYVLPALLYAACSDRLIATAGHAAGIAETSMWRWAGMAVLYGLRALVALPSTARGLRQHVLNLTPLPEPPHRVRLESALGRTRESALAATPGSALQRAPEPLPQVRPEGALQSAPEPALQGAPGAAPTVTPRAPAESTLGRTRDRSRRAPSGRTRSAPVTPGDAEREFAAQLASGTLPSLRQIRARLHVGDRRAPELRAHLEGVLASTNRD